MEDKKTCNARALVCDDNSFDQATGSLHFIGHDQRGATPCARLHRRARPTMEPVTAPGHTWW
jgi:hypothetical protein